MSMRIEGDPVPLKLIHPPQLTRRLEAVRPVSPVAPARAAPRADALDFESVYIAQLPRVPRSEAHLRLEQLRQQLVAARTDVPIHFDDGGAARSANPYAIGYTRSAPLAADVNAAATERLAAGEAEA